MRTADADEIRSEMTTVGTIKSVMPLRLKRSTDGILNWFTFPLEPLVSISGKNEIIRRTPAKGKGTGTVKERWSQGDYEISIQGIFIAAENEYPKESVQQLRNLFDTASHLDVEHDILLLFGITRLAIESVSFPHTKRPAKPELRDQSIQRQSGFAFYSGLTAFEMYSMNFDITIRKYRLAALEKVAIKCSVENLADTADITLPGTLFNRALKVEQKIAEGDAVRSAWDMIGYCAMNFPGMSPKSLLITTPCVFIAKMNSTNSAKTSRTVS